MTVDGGVGLRLLSRLFRRNKSSGTCSHICDLKVVHAVGFL